MGVKWNPPFEFGNIHPFLSRFSLKLDYTLFTWWCAMLSSHCFRRGTCLASRHKHEVNCDALLRSNCFRLCSAHVDKHERLVHHSIERKKESQVVQCNAMFDGGGHCPDLNSWLKKCCPILSYYGLGLHT